MAFSPSEGFSQPQEVFSSLYTDASPSDLPIGLSPDNAEIIYRPGKTATRPGFKKRLNPSPDPAEDVVSLVEYSLPIGDYLAMWMFSDGALWKQNNRTAGKISVEQFPAGSQFRSVSAFEKQWFAFNNPNLADDFSKSSFVGADVPRYYDGTTLWRVTQDAPGANPSFANVPVAPVPLVATSTTGTISISSAKSTTPVTYQIQVGGNLSPQDGGHGDPGETETITIYTTITYGCTTPVPVSWLGTQVTVTGIVGTGSNLVNVTGTITNVSGSNFTINIGTGSTFVNLTGLAGTGTVAGNYFQRSGNIVTAYVGTTAPANFKAGLFAKVINSNASQINGPAWTITSISRDTEGLVTIVVSTQLTNIPSGTSLYISSVDTTNFPAGYHEVFQVVSVTSTSTTFTISDPTWGTSAVVSSTGTAKQTWSGTFQILSVGVDSNGENFFTYFQLGPDINLTSTGGTPQAQIEAQIPPGPRSAVLMFKSLNGAITAPSVPIQLSIAGGTNILSAQDIALGPAGTAQRIIAFTPAFGASFYYITPAVIPAIGGLSPVVSLGTIIDDNISTTAILDFSDQQLTAGTQIDIEGNNLFNQVVLGPMLGCIDYAGRMGWWGEVNNIKNLINMGFDGGSVPATPYSPTNQTIAGAGANASGARPWTNPNNVTSAVSYATVTLAAGLSANYLQATNFGFAIDPSLTVLGLQVDFSASANPSSKLSGTPSLNALMLKAGVIASIGNRVVATPTPANVTAGGGSDLWSTTWTPADINDPNFGVAFFATAGSGSTAFQVGNVRITVYVIGALTEPLGWDSSTTINGITPDGRGTLVNNPTSLGLGFAYQMASGGSHTQNCMLSQGAYQDFYGAPILQPGRSYYVRFQGKLDTGTFSGNVSFVIYSPSVGVLANVNVNSFTFSTKWITEQFSDQMPDSIPSDTVFYFCLDGTATTDFSIILDELELIDVQSPVLFQQVRLSYFNNPFGYDQITGILGVAGSAKITAAFKQRGYLYLLTDGPMSQTQNNGQSEPNGWGVTQFADECDCFGPNGVTNTEDIAWWVGNSGLRIFSGAKPVKLSQEIQPDWDAINKAVPLAMWAVNDPFERVLYIGIASGVSEVVNQIIPMSYRSVDATYNVPDPLHISYSGKMIASDLVRKWTRWNRPMSCGAILTLPTGKQMFFGGQGFGNFYSLDATLKTDDDYGVIASYYTTSFFFNHDIEQQAQNLGLHRKIYEYLAASLTGTGNMQITAYVNNLNNPWGPIPTVWDDVNQMWIPSGSPTKIPAVPLQSESNFDLEWDLNIRAERCAFKFAALPLDGQTDSGFELTHLVVTAAQDVIPVRGSTVA